MKYIKTFEIKKLKYKKDDYVYVVGYPDIFLNFARIAKVNDSHKKNGHWDYFINFIDNEDDTYHDGVYGTHIDEFDIYRLLNQDEIDKFEAKISFIKYNI